MVARRPAAAVVAVKEVSSAVAKEEWSEERLLPGDIIEKVTWVDGQQGAVAPFANGKIGLEDELRQIYHSSHPEVLVSVRRLGGVNEELPAIVVSEEMVIPKKHYALRSYHDTRHIAYLADSTEDECQRWQESTMKTLKKSLKLDLQSVKRERGENVLHAYPWSQKMQAYLPTKASSMLFSMLFMPFHDFQERVICKDIEETTARAMAWFSSAQASGVPIIFISIQTDLICKEGFKDTRGFFDTTSMGKVRHATYGGRFRLACTENTLINVTRAIRLWYVPPAAEIPIDLTLEHGEAKFGLSLASTEEGFCHVAAVDDGSAAKRAGVKHLLDLATMQNKLLVISRVGEEKVVPWLVACDGSIHCYGVSTIRQTLSQLRSTHKTARIHLMVWESMSDLASANQTMNDVSEVVTNQSPNRLDLMCLPSETSTQATASKGSTKRRAVSWSDSNGSQLAIVNEF